MLALQTCNIEGLCSITFQDMSAGLQQDCLVTDHLRLATATMPPYARMKHRRATEKLGSKLMLKPAHTCIHVRPTS